ncbi:MULTISPECIES: pilus assembly PilX family protein [unclassified Cupriavidus]|uniref:pilus assembly PilX family protein n=1 Tax=Cupriavidus sp. H19C3 TaxID=3241603 RepID=UPI003BF87FD9
MTDPRRSRQDGFVLMLALCLVAALGALGAALLRHVPVRERIAANAIEKLEATGAAQDALRLGESWLAEGGAPNAVPCASAARAQQGAMRVCDRALAAPLAPPWPERTEPLPGFQGARAPRAALHIHDLGLSAGGDARLYQVTAVGYSERGEAVAILRSTYRLGTAARNLGAP